MIAGVSFWRFYFRLFPGAIKSAQIIEFLKALRTHIRRKLLVVWDRLPGHRSRAVCVFLDSLKGAIQSEFLPAYAPELNPVEYLWGHAKHRELAHFCPANLGQLARFARARQRAMQRRPTLVTAFWKQAELF